MDKHTHSVINFAETPPNSNSLFELTSSCGSANVSKPDESNSVCAPGTPCRFELGGLLVFCDFCIAAVVWCGACVLWSVTWWEKWCICAVVCDMVGEVVYLCCGL